MRFGQQKKKCAFVTKRIRGNFNLPMSALYCMRERTLSGKVLSLNIDLTPCCREEKA